MNETETISVGEPMPSIEKVSVSDALRVLVTWNRSYRKGTTTEVDLAPLIYSRKIFAPLRSDRALFQTVHIVEEGAAIAWGDGEQVDVAATTIERLADEAMMPADFAVFLQRHSLSFGAAAAQLGISRRLVAYYAKERRIPRYIALACAYLDHVQTSVSAPLMTSNVGTVLNSWLTDQCNVFVVGAQVDVRRLLKTVDTMYSGNTDRFIVPVEFNTKDARLAANDRKIAELEKELAQRVQNQQLRVSALQGALSFPRTALPPPTGNAFDPDYLVVTTQRPRIGS